VFPASFYFILFINLETKTPSNRKKPFIFEINFLRLVAALNVTLYHVLIFMSDRINAYLADYLIVLNWFSVESFLLITGFLFIYNDNHTKDNFPLQAYYRKIIMRLVVPYILWSLIYLYESIYHILGELISFLLTNSFNSYLLNKLLIKVIRNIILSNASSHLWFFQIIIFIYFVFPLIRIELIKNNLWKVAVFLIIIQLVYTFFASIDRNNFKAVDLYFHPIFSQNLALSTILEFFIKLTNNFFFFVGYVAFGMLYSLYFNEVNSKIFDKINKKYQILMVILIFLSSGLITLSGIMFEHFPPFLLHKLLIICLILSIGKSNFMKKPSMQNKILTLSGMSYGIYLVHPLLLINLLLGLQNLFFEAPEWLALYLGLIILTILIMYSIITTYLLKKMPKAWLMGF
jgi:peptidoglycan/LPS O-acetylase OafA/YrhL